VRLLVTPYEKGVLPKSTEIDSQRVPVCCQPETVLIGFIKIALYAVVRFVPVQVLDARSELIPAQSLLQLNGWRCV